MVVQVLARVVDMYHASHSLHGLEKITSGGTVTIAQE